MKKRSIVICAMIGLSGLLHQTRAQSTGEDLFVQANNLLKNGNCDDARKAISLYNRAKKADINLRNDCDKRILKCQAIIKKGCNVSLELSTDVVEIPYQGGDYQVGVISSKNWKVDGLQKWISTESYDKNSLILQCRDQNNSTRERISNLMVKIVINLN